MAETTTGEMDLRTIFANSEIQKFNGGGKILMSYADSTTNTSDIKCISYTDFNNSIKSLIQTPHQVCAGKIGSMTNIKKLTTEFTSDKIVEFLCLERRNADDTFTKITTAEDINTFFNECYTNGTTIVCSTAREQFFVQYFGHTWVLMALSSKVSSTGTVMIGLPQVVTINILYDSSTKTLSIPYNPIIKSLV